MHLKMGHAQAEVDLTRKGLHVLSDDSELSLSWKYSRSRSCLIKSEMSADNSGQLMCLRARSFGINPE